MEKFKKIVHECLGYAVELTQPISELDSLDSVELMIELETEYNIDIEDSIAEKFETLEDVYKFILDTQSLKECKWKVGQTLVNRTDNNPYKIVKIESNEIVVTRTLTIRPSDFDDWVDH